MRVGLRAKLLGAIAVYLGLLLLIGGLGLFAAQTSIEYFDLAVDHHVRELSLTTEIVAEVDAARSATLSHVLSNSAFEQDTFEREIAQHDASVTSLLTALKANEARSEMRRTSGT